MHAIAIEHSIVTTVIVVGATAIATEVLATVWLIIVKRLQLRPSAVEPKVLLPAKLLVVKLIAFHPSHLLGRASALLFVVEEAIELVLTKELPALSQLLGHLLSLLQRKTVTIIMWH